MAESAARDAEEASSSSSSSATSEPDDDDKGFSPTFNSEFDEILENFFAVAITLIVKKIGLCPKAGFKSITMFGIPVPWFRHPESLGYVHGVSEKIVFLMKKNILEGAVLHVVIDKEKKPFVTQRFVFRPGGGFDPREYETADPIRSEEVLKSVNKNCKDALETIQNFEMDEIKCPWFSKWSISFGIKKEFLAKCRGTGPKGPFAQDPNGLYFPFRKKLQLKRKERKARLVTRTSNRMKNPRAKNATACSVDKNSPEDSEEMDEWEEISSSEDDDESGTTIKPISSFQIIDGLMLNVYNIDYPVDPLWYKVMANASKAEEADEIGSQ